MLKQWYPRKSYAMEVEENGLIFLSRTSLKDNQEKNVRPGRREKKFI